MDRRLLHYGGLDGGGLLLASYRQGERRLGNRSAIVQAPAPGPRKEAKCLVAAMVLNPFQQKIHFAVNQYKHWQHTRIMVYGSYSNATPKFLLQGYRQTCVCIATCMYPPSLRTPPRPRGGPCQNHVRADLSNTRCRERRLVRELLGYLVDPQLYLQRGLMHHRVLPEPVVQLGVQGLVRRRS